MAKPAKIQRRKPDAERKENGVTVWFTGEQKELLDRAAARADDPLTHWMRKVLVRVAREELGETEAR